MGTLAAGPEAAVLVLAEEGEEADGFEFEGDGAPSGGGGCGARGLQLVPHWRRRAVAVATALAALPAALLLLHAGRAPPISQPPLPERGTGPSSPSAQPAARGALGLSEFTSSSASHSVTADDIESSILLLGEHEDARADGATTLEFRSRLTDKLGNAMMAYWNARAVAFLEGLDFEWVGLLPAGSDAHVIEHLPRKVPAGVPTPQQHELYDLLKSPVGPLNVCWSCQYPQAYPYAPWHLLHDAQLRETRELVNTLSRQGGAQLQHRPRSAAVHLRCDEEILGVTPGATRGTSPRRELAKTDYGLLPHRFVLENLPGDVAEVTLVSRKETFEPFTMCGKATADLKEVLEAQRNVRVLLRSTSARDDWLFLATAPVLLCAPSTFCVTAGLGNPNVVFVPVNGGATAVAAPGPRFGDRKELAPPGFHWVDTDYAPGKYLWNRSWKALQRYLRSASCRPSEGLCVPCCSDHRLRSS